MIPRSVVPVAAKHPAGLIRQLEARRSSFARIGRETRETQARRSPQTGTLRPTFNRPMEVTMSSTGLDIDASEPAPSVVPCDMELEVLDCVREGPHDG